MTDHQFLPPGFLQPTDRAHMRQLLNSWVIKTYDSHGPEWQAISKKSLRRVNARIFRRKLLSALWLAEPLHRFRRTTSVKTSYDTIWQGESWPQPVGMDNAAKTNHATWDNEGILANSGGVSQPHLDRLMHAISTLRPRRVLEVGSGAGHNLFALAAEFPDIAFEGLELSSAGIETCRRAQSMEHLSPKLIAYSPRPPRDETAYRRIVFSQGSAADMPYPDKSFDLVFTRLAIEQMDQIKHLVFAEVARVSEKHCVFIEPFADYADNLLRQRAALKKNHFREPVSYLLQFGLVPKLAFHDWPQKLDQGIGMVLAEVN